jgi:hypothetical protein
MTHPVKIPFATDDDHPAGGDAWSAQPNKEEPAAGRMSEGYPPETEPAAEHWNWLINELAKLADRAAGLRLSTLLEAHFSNVTNWGNPFSAVWDPSANRFLAIDTDGYVIETVAQPGDWDDITPPTSAPATGQYADIAADDTGRLLALVDQPNGNVEYEYGAGWNTTSPIATIGWTQCLWVGSLGTPLWLIGSASGHLETAVSTGAWPGWTSRTSNIADFIYCMATNGKSGSNQRTIVLSSANKTISDDLVTWTAAAHGFSDEPSDIAYSTKGDRWCAALHDGTIAVSDDNGATWSEKTPERVGGGSSNDITIASDDDGHWIAVFASAGNWYVIASIDNGDTWHEVHIPNMGAGVATVVRGAIAFGLDQFVIVGDQGARYTPRLINP